MAAARREKIDAPVLCVGNFTVGGTGKTPVAIALARQARRMRLKPGFLSRGHGGSFAKPHLVDPAPDSASHVGDEPLLLAEHAPVAVTPDRAAGARLLLEARLRLPDHGRRLPERAHPHRLCADGGRRALRPRQRPRHSRPDRCARRWSTSCALPTRLAEDGRGQRRRRGRAPASRAGKPVFEATTRPRDAGRFAGRRFLAFAGIGHPEKFFDTMAEAGGDGRADALLSPTIISTARTNSTNWPRRRATPGFGW